MVGSGPILITVEPIVDKQQEMSDDEIDPLDAFLQQNEEEVKAGMEQIPAMEESATNKKQEIMETEEYDYEQLVKGEQETVKEDTSGSRVSP